MGLSPTIEILHGFSPVQTRERCNPGSSKVCSEAAAAAAAAAAAVAAATAAIAAAVVKLCCGGSGAHR